MKRRYVHTAGGAFWGSKTQRNKSLFQQITGIRSRGNRHGNRINISKELANCHPATIKFLGIITNITIKFVMLAITLCLVAGLVSFQ